MLCFGLDEGKVYHTCDSLLNSVDAIQDTLLDRLGITDKQALFDFNLAPLSARRDMAMLGLVHRTVLGKGPPQFARFFKLAEGSPARRSRHKLQLLELQADVTDSIFPSSTGAPADYVARSALGLCVVCNLLRAAQQCRSSSPTSRRC